MVIHSVKMLMYTSSIKQHSKVLSILLVSVVSTIYKYSILLLLVLVALYPVVASTTYYKYYEVLWV